MDFEDIQDELFRLEYPYLHAGSDPDIERYCYLRAAGQGRAALDIYQYRIKPRYPDDTLRMALLHTYRARDPLFPRLLTVGYRRLAERALERVRRLIGYIAEKVRTYNKQDVYSTIKAIEDILRFFPREQYEAISSLDRMYRYAQVLNYQVGPIEQAVGLVRSYLSRSLPVLERERNRRRDQERGRERGPKEAAVDFSLVVFSGADLARIEIPGRFTRPEDQTLAYCMKYWNLIHDAAFEQILFLYSRKYGKKNHAIYSTIRRGRNANYRDEDILSSVMSMLVTGYYYSIQGDRYLQWNWQHIKNAMDRAATKSPPAPPVKPPPTAAKPAKAAPVKPPKAAPAKPAKAVPVKPPKAVPVNAPEAVQTPKPAPPRPTGGSVSDRLRKLSGRGYDLYQDRFLAHARPAIRKVLGTGRGIFFSLPEKAEDLVYHYLRDHYADPYMNWPESGECRQLAEEGFNLPSLDPVIEECFKKIGT